ncbi:MAG: phosphoribosylglycinamide formyltransferase [Stellaceae bacterium]|jgi:phosphoribosylglycinamide formyltransferase 1
MTGRLRVAVLISGRGSNLQALIASCADPAVPAEIVSVISNRSEAPGLGFAAAAGIPCAVIADGDRRGFAARADSLLREQGVELICLAGFMRLLETDFVETWRDRIINIHPSLLPSFRGLRAQRQALAAGVRFAGCTVHFVRPEVDCGPIIGQAVVPIHPGDDEAQLSERILRVEHRLYPLALRLIAEGRVRIVDERVEINGWRAPQLTLLNPQDSTDEPFASHRG